MMIKMKAWDKINKRIADIESIEFLDPIEHRTGINAKVFVNGVKTSYWLDRGDFELLSCTYLKDKNGSDIYEGWIIQGGKKDECCLVVWDESNARFIAYGKTYKIFAHKFYLFNVVGNWFDNRELIDFDIELF